MIKYLCPSCQQKLGVPDNYAGRRIRCNKCSQPSIVPKPVVEVIITPTQNPVPPSAPAPQSESLDSLDIVSESDQPVIEEDRNAAILRQAHLDKTAKESRPAAGKTKAKSSAKSDRPDKTSSGGFSLTDIVPDILHTPLSIVLAIILMAATVVAWCIAASYTERAMTIFEWFIPLAAAAGLRLLTVNRTLVHGLLAIVIGLAGIVIGRTIVTKKVIIPWIDTKTKDEVLVDFKTTQTNPLYQIKPGESAKFISQDGDYMACVALIAAVDQENADPKIARSLAIRQLRLSNKTNFFEYLSNASNGSSGIQAPKPTEAEIQVIEKADKQCALWVEDSDRLSAARRYYPALSAIFLQADLQRKLEAPDGGFRYALINTIGFLEIFWIFIGLSGAYTMAVFET